MKDLTYDGWALNCRHVIKGEKSTKRNAVGDALFSYEQTEPDYERPKDYDDQQDFFCGD